MMVQDNGNVIVYVDDNGKPQVDVRFQDETVWLTQAQGDISIKLNILRETGSNYKKVDIFLDNVNKTC
jgi:hypothetical protein